MLTVTGLLFFSCGQGTYQEEAANNSLPADSLKFKQHLNKLLLSGQAFTARDEGDSAVYYYNKGIEAAAPYPSCQAQLAMFYRELGRFYSHRSSYANAIAFYNKAISISEKCGVNDDHIMYISELGNIYKLIGEHDKALPYFEKARRYAERTGNLSLFTYALNAMGDLARLRGNLDEAISYHEQSMEALKKNNGHIDFWACTSLGKIYTTKNEFDKAEEYFGLVLREGAKDKDLVSQSYLNLSRCDHKRGLNDKAIQRALTAYNVSLTSPDIDIRSAISKELAALYTETGKFKEALEFTLVHHALEDSINNTEQVKKRAEAEFRYKEEKLVEKNDLELKVEKEKRSIEQKRHNAIVLFIIVILAITLVFSLLIYRSLQRNKRQQKIIMEQKHLVETKQVEILDSIHYAKRIQNALFLNDQLLSQHYPGHFIISRPKDIVSGDFYWSTTDGDRFYLAVCDSTGHGVPGAFMSLLSIGFLNEAINEKKIAAPHDIFNYVRRRLVESISREEQKDGFDGTLICHDKKSNKISYSSANSSAILVSAGTGTELLTDKMPVGKGENADSFSLFSLEPKPGDMLYLFTDGYADQFGGPKGKKFKYKQLKDAILAHAGSSPAEQKEQLLKAFTDWKGEHEQVDDVCLVGVRF